MKLKFFSIINVCDLWEIVEEQYNNYLDKKDKLKQFKSKLNDILEENHWDFDDIFRDHSYRKTSESSIF